jgi:Protein of unknown function (DUF3551)
MMILLQNDRRAVNFNLLLNTGRITLLFFCVDGADTRERPSVGPGAKTRHRGNKMRKILKMAAAPATGLFALALVAMATPAAASPGEFCRVDSGSGGMVQCGFSTMEQCQGMVAGRSGWCERDPFLPDSNSNALAYQPKHPLAKNPRKPVETR